MLDIGDSGNLLVFGSRGDLSVNCVELPELKSVAVVETLLPRGSGCLRIAAERGTTAWGTRLGEVMMAEFGAEHPGSPMHLRVATVQQKRHVTAVAVSRRGELVAAGDETGGIDLWVVADDSRKTLKVAAQSPGVTALCFNDTTAHLASVLDNGEFRVLDVASGRQLAGALSDGPVLNVQWHGTNLGTLNANGTVSIWSIETSSAIEHR